MKVDKNAVSSKVKSIHSILLVFAILLFVFLFRWQIVQGSKFDKIAKSRVQSSEIDSVRGSIYSRDGSTLAYSEPRVNVNIWIPDLEFFEEKGIQTREEFTKKLAPILGKSDAELRELIEKYKKDGVQRVPLAESLPKEEWFKIEALRTDKYPDSPLRGINSEYISKRIYPEARLASHILGLTNVYKDKLIGVGGLEEKYNDMLNPIKGFIISEKDARGQSVTAELLPTIEAKNGSSLYTTIDKKLQTIIESKIKDGVEKYDAKSGSIIVMDPKTGEILALANYPDYDPNKREEPNPEAYGDIAISSPYEIGSIGKIFTASAAIDLGEVTPDSIIMPNGHEGCEKIHNDLLPVCTWDKKPKPPQPLWECFADSDNICFYHTAEKLNRKDFYDYLSRFGVGVPTGVDLRSESYGILKPYDSWNVGDVSAFSYGHGYLVNAMQGITAVASIPNNGVRMKPFVVNKVVDGDGNENEYKPVILGRTVEKETADQITDMMRKNFDRSLPEWYYWDLKKYDIAVKSGTALIANSTGYTNNINATFIGFDASANRTFIMLVRLEDPKIPSYDRLAFYNVRPLWLDTFVAIKDHLGVPTKQ